MRTPDSLQNIPETVRQLPHEKLIVVFGWGDRDGPSGPSWAKCAAKMSDFVFATSDNPRTEIPRHFEGDRAGLRRGQRARDGSGRREAIASAISMAKEECRGHCGKGHEDYQIISTRVIAFDDRKLARNCCSRN
jgi:UDP-N-acetylmuramoyl-L-alanyl-D-glutamate--2,6-diaminopimelate ligase